jgi:hypothetical protein
VRPLDNKRAGLLDPIAPGRFAGVSRLTFWLALGLPASLLAFAILEGVIGGPTHSSATQISPLDLAPIVLPILGVLCALASVGSFVRDLLVGPRRRRQAVALARDRDHQAAVEAETALTRVRAAQCGIYAQHHQALVAEAKRLLAPDRYGRRDEAAIAQELSTFQEEVVEPKLLRDGHADHLIREAFRLDRAELVRAILVS